MNGSATPPTAAATSPTRSRPRLWLFRTIAAIGLPLVLLGGAEIALRIGGYGQSPHFFIPDATAGFVRTNPDYLGLFLPPAFDLRPLNVRVAMPKPANTVRVVVLGESAAQGVPEPAFGFAPQLRAQLRGRFRGKNIEVVDAGVVAINSHIVRLIADDALACSPDAVVVYLGNNEVVGPYGPGCAYLSATPPLALIRLSLWARTTRLGQLIARTVSAIAAKRGGPREWGGMSMFVDHGVAGDDPRLERVYSHFEANLRAIVHVAARQHVPVILSTVASNLQDCAPFLSRHRHDLSAADRQLWQAAYDRGRLAWWLNENDTARRDLLTAVALDPQHADSLFLLGKTELALGDVASARKHFVAAEHWDGLRFRPDPKINEIVRQVAAESPAAVQFVDLAKELGSDATSTTPPAGRSAFFEHVHFDWAGNFEVARALANPTAMALHAPPATNSAWLDSDACAAALGLTPYSYAAVVRKNWNLVQAPPFTNQLTYPEDQAKAQWQLTALEANAKQRPVIVAAKAKVSSALAADPDNPALWKFAEEIDDDLGDLSGALDDIRKQQALQPDSFALSADEAIKLARLGETSAAEKLLRATASRCAPRDLALLAPAFVDLFTRTNRLREALVWLDSLIGQQPRNTKLRLLRASVLMGQGDRTTAEAVYREILRDEPASQEALEAVVVMLQGTTRNAEAESLSRGALASQPNNHTNNLRVAVISRQRSDATTELTALRAAERSGPIAAAVEMRLGRMLLNAGPREEALEHLAIARRLALVEGDPASAKDLAEVIAALRTQQR